MMESDAGPVLARHLDNFIELSTAERRCVEALANVPVRTVKARRDLISEGAEPRSLILIVSGWACRYKMLEDGRRQIVAFLVPGDMCDLHNIVLTRMDHTIGALTEVRFAELSHEAVTAASVAHPRLGHAFWWQMLVNVATQREWTMNIGQRSAPERIGSLFCELLLRLRAVDLVHGDSYDFPLTQSDLAEATGLTSVHVNRTLQQMRASGLVSLNNRVLTILDYAVLQDASLFSPEYLHQSARRPIEWAPAYCVTGR